MHRQKVDDNLVDIRFIRNMHFWKRVDLMIELNYLIINNLNVFVDLEEMIKFLTGLKN
jgi:hypothetical protein